ncbi:putative baseplate assembly protein [Frankia sp. Cr1]|uniref:putative baseplate assembly protein n=1 Tax=Frankia sp. Cr1 TaxID=3073931 RepID=UPI002AD474E0|nr:putative baseplate assembly protein [Frankia sp. Cr1]
MSLPAPNLDDRTFQQLVDDAKRFIRDRCPDWTNHNVSDPGVTLIETFAWMTDLLLYRLNRVPDRNYVKFLDLLGVGLFPPVAARAEVSFRLAAQQESSVGIARGTVVSTRRTAAEPAVDFTTVDDLAIVPARSVVVASMVEPDSLRDHTSMLGRGNGFACFDPRPKPGDALYLGFDRTAPATIVLLRFTCEVAGHGIDPRRPPLAWEAWDGDAWCPCDVEQDTTNGLNTTGVVELHLPRTHATRSVGGRSSAWVRCRVIELSDDDLRRGVKPYRESPRIVSVTGATVGGDVDAVQGALVAGQVLGRSEGVAGQSFRLPHAPVLTTSEPVVIEVSAGDPRRDDTTSPTSPTSPTGWQAWQRVASFADSGPTDRHVTLDATSGEVRFGPMVRLADATVRQYGAVPPKDAVIRVRPFRTGGGRQGNVTARALVMLRSSIPYVSAVYNRRPATGGVDGESVDEARTRGPLVLRSRDRAVTAADFEVLAREAAPEIARVRCVVETSGRDGGAVRVLLVPRAPSDADGRLALTQLVVPERTGAAIRSYLDDRRVVGARVSVEPPTYVGTSVVARVAPAHLVTPDAAERAALRALYRYLHPITGGPAGTGWPFGRSVHVGDIFGVLRAVPELGFVDEVVLFQRNPLTGARLDPVERIDLPPTSLVFSFDHQVDLMMRD